MKDPSTVDVVILSCGFGQGHYQAAKAVGEALKTTGRLSVAITDYLALVPERLAWSTLAIHQFLARDWPSGYGLMYRVTDWLAGVPGWRALTERPGRSRLQVFLGQAQPRLVVATHPMPLAALASLRRRGQWTGPVVGVVTDYVLHAEWVSSGVDAYAVPTHDVASWLSARDRGTTPVRVTGIPVWLGVSGEARRGGSGAGHPRVLLVFGSQGMRPSAARRILRQLQPWQSWHVIIVTSHDPALRELCLNFAKDMTHWTVLPPQPNLPALMADCDVVVCKGGALTASEALALGRPLVIFTATPGQEEGNARWLDRAGAAIFCPDPTELGEAIHGIIADAQQRSRLTRRALSVCPPDSAHQAAHWCLEWFN